MYELSTLLASPKYHSSYMRGAGIPQASEKDRDDWHRREYERNRRLRQVAEAAEKSEEK